MDAPARGELLMDFAAKSKDSRPGNRSGTDGSVNTAPSTDKAKPPLPGNGQGRLSVRTSEFCTRKEHLRFHNGPVAVFHGAFQNSGQHLQHHHFAETGDAEHRVVPLPLGGGQKQQIRDSGYGGILVGRNGNALHPLLLT